MVSFAAGWLASEAGKADYLSRGESIGNTWESHMSALLNNQGEPAGEAKLYQSNAFSLSALTLGLAANYEDIPKEQWQRIEPHLNAVVLVAPPEIRRQTQAVVQCIQVAKQDGHLAQDCLDAARAVPWSKAAATVPN